jgi:hypothetical protein
MKGEMKNKSNNGTTRGAMQNVPVLDPSSDDEADAAIWPTAHRAECVALGTLPPIYRNSDMPRVKFPLSGKKRGTPRASSKPNPSRDVCPLPTLCNAESSHETDDGQTVSRGVLGAQNGLGLQS